MLGAEYDDFGDHVYRLTPSNLDREMTDIYNTITYRLHDNHGRARQNQEDQEKEEQEEENEEAQGRGDGQIDPRYSLHSARKE